MGDIFIWFLIGGLIVSLFSSPGRRFFPTEFRRLFGGAPSLALATIRQDDRAERQGVCRNRMSLDDDARDHLLRIRLERQLDFKT